MTVGSLLREIDSAEITEWMAEDTLRREDAKPKPQTRQEAKFVLDSLKVQKRKGR